MRRREWRMQRKSIMVRYGRIYTQICSEENVRRALKDVLHTTLAKMEKRRKEWDRREIFRLREAERRGKKYTVRPYKYRACEKEALELIKSEEAYEAFIKQVVYNLVTETYEFGPMATAFVNENKKRRKIDYPIHLIDRVYDHCLINIVGPLLLKKMTADTYASLKGRGLKDASEKIRKFIAKHPDYYAIVTDYKHFYETISHEVLKADLAHAIKDKKALRLCYAIIDKFSPGVAIGVSPDGYFANYYLASLDHLLKEVYHVECVVRYMDDIICFVKTKEEAWKIYNVIDDYGKSKKINLKSCSRVTPVSAGIRTLGYVFYPTHTLLRKRIKEDFKKSVKSNWKLDDASFKMKVSAYYGWCKYGNCRNLFRKVLGERYYLFEKNMEYKKLSDIRSHDEWFGLPNGSRVSVTALFDQEIIVFEIKEVEVKGERKMAVRFAYPDKEDEMKFFLTKSGVITDRLMAVRDSVPFMCTIRQKKNYYSIE